MPKSKFQIDLEKNLSEISPDDLKSLREFLTDHPKIAPILNPILPDRSTILQKTFCTCEYEDIRALDLDVSRVQDMSSPWCLPNNYPPFRVSVWFEQFVKRLRPWNMKSSEATTRTFIDVMLLEVMQMQFDEDRRLFVSGEVPRVVKSKKIVLTGTCDYYLSYYQLNSDIESFPLLIGEAKKVSEKRNIWQLIGYCAQSHLRRKDEKIADSTVFGFISDGACWEFIKIDDSSRVWTSDVISNRTEIATWLKYVIECAQKIIPCLTPAASKEDDWNSIKNEVNVLSDQFKWTSLEDSEDIDDTEFAQLYALQVEEERRKIPKSANW